MRVLHVQKAKGIGGSERHLLALLPALAARGVEIRMCVLETGDGDRFVSELRHAGVDVTVRRAGPHINPTLVPGLMSEVRSFRPDLVHTHLIHADIHGQLAAKACHVPAVSSVHDTADFYRHEPYRSASRFIGRLPARRIAISEHVARFLRELGLASPGRISLVYYGIDVDTWTVAPVERRRARESMGLAEDQIVVGIASRLIPGKGHDVLVEAFGIAERDNPRLHLLVAGDGPERDGLESIASRMGLNDAVQFLGFIDDVRSFLAACELLVFPTLPELSEGFGLAALEAMASGLPVVASDVGSLPEVVTDGVTGLLVAPASPDALSAAIARLGADTALRERLGAQGRERARADFTLDAMVSGTIAVYEAAT